MSRALASEHPTRPSMHAPHQSAPAREPARGPRALRRRAPSRDQHGRLHRPGGPWLAPLLAPLALLALLTLGISPAQAASRSAFGTTARRNWGRAARRPQPSYAAELRIGPYLPNADQSPGLTGGATPLANHFGTQNRLLLGFELDWQALRIPRIGSLGPGFGLGYTRLSGVSFLQDGGKSTVPTYLSVMPTYLAAVFRFDYLIQETSIPLAFYGKLGFGFARWWASNSVETSKVGQTTGSDLSYGWQYGLGGMLLMDWLDPDTAASMDASSGIQHAYLFGEWYGSNLDSFGKSMQVGDTTWVTGLAVEM